MKGPDESILRKEGVILMTNLVMVAQMQGLGTLYKRDGSELPFPGKQSKSNRSNGKPQSRLILISSYRFMCSIMFTHSTKQYSG